MFIKVKNMQDVEIIINASHILRVGSFTKDDGQEYCHLEFVNGAVQEVKGGLRELDTLIDANSIEKIIEQRKLENMRLRQQMQYREIIDELTGGVRNGN